MARSGSFFVMETNHDTSVPDKTPERLARTSAHPGRRWIFRIIVVALIVSAALFASVVDRHYRVNAVEATGVLVYQGVSIDGTPVSGLTREQLEDRVDALVALAERRMKLTIILDGKKYIYNSKDLGITFDTAAAIKSAWTANKPKTQEEKFQAAYGMWRPASKGIKMEWRLSKTALIPRIAKSLSDSVHHAPVDGRIVLSGLVPTIKAGVDGRYAPANAIALLIKQTIQRRAFSSPIVVKSTVLSAKQVTDRQSIVVNKTSHTTTLYEGSAVVKQYPNAVGMPEYPTPSGDWRVVDKIVNPTWVNPHSAWSAGMPETIPGGPDSPLGERALALNAPGILIHGIPPGEFSSIGSDASHGCIRTMPDDVLDLFGRVEVGTPVFIR